MSIALIGGSGFIGSRLAQNLQYSSREFIIIDKIESPIFPELTHIGDVRNPGELAVLLKGVTTIVNLAAEHRDDVTPISLYTDVNISGAENICHAASELGIHDIIFTSSVAVYGKAAPDSDETAICSPLNEYGRTKLEAENVFHNWESKNTKNRLAIVRPTVVFGEGNRGNVYNLFKQIAGRRFLFIGNGTNHKAMAYVGNVSSFLMQVIESPDLVGTWNYVDTPISDMKSLVTQIRRKLGIGNGTGFRIPSWIGLPGGTFFDFVAFITRRKLPISLVRVKKFMADSSFSADKALSTGFQPPFDLDKSLDNVLSYEFPNEYRKSGI